MMRRLVATGALVRLSRGWYAVPHVQAPLRSAVQAGGRLSCVSALAWHGVWTRAHSVHISVPHGAHRGLMPALVVHWRHMPAPTGATLVEGARDAFEQFAACGSDLDVIIAADSALNLGLLSRADVRRTLERTRRGRRVLARVDGRAESGTETIVRVALRARRIKLRTQVAIAGVGRVDMVVGDRLVIEVDGQDWHDRPSTFEEDRRRDAALVAKGFVVMRYSYKRVMFDLDGVLTEILAVIGRREHRWSARHRELVRKYG
jgi:very-short-patch-repair endonuclease